MYFFLDNDNSYKSTMLTHTHTHTHTRAQSHAPTHTLRAFSQQSKPHENNTKTTEVFLRTRRLVSLWWAILALSASGVGMESCPDSPEERIVLHPTSYFVYYFL